MPLLRPKLLTLCAVGALCIGAADATEAIAQLAFASEHPSFRGGLLETSPIPMGGHGVVDARSERPRGPAHLVGFPSSTFWLLDDRGEGLPLVSAHRGRPEIDAFPENCLESMARLMQEGSFIAEIDISVSKDGVLFLFHDEELDRLTRNTGLAKDRTWSELDTMRLRDATGRLTEYTIPSLDEALAQAKGKGLLSLDRKRPVTLRQITSAARDRGMLAEVSLILYDMDDYREWAELPDLGPVSFEALDVLKVEELAQRNRELYARFGISPFREEGTRPTSGFLGVGVPNMEMLRTAKALRIRATVGTFGELDRRAEADKGETYRELIRSGVSVIATNRPLAVSEAIYQKKSKS